LRARDQSTGRAVRKEGKNIGHHEAAAPIRAPLNTLDAGHNWCVHGIFHLESTVNARSITHNQASSLPVTLQRRESRSTTTRDTDRFHEECPVAGRPANPFGIAARRIFSPQQPPPPPREHPVCAAPAWARNDRPYRRVRVTLIKRFIPDAKTWRRDASSDGFLTLAIIFWPAMMKLGSFGTSSTLPICVSNAKQKSRAEHACSFLRGLRSPGRIVQSLPVTSLTTHSQNSSMRIV